MGVQGLAPFLQKKCPDVIRELPNRLNALRGKTIVLDATLVTTRFHFAQIPHERRHVLGWYRLLSELKSNEVNVICVFDGTERSTAKKNENIRRRAVRDTNLARGNLEHERAQRLRRFEQLLTQLPSDQRLQDSPLLAKLRKASGSESFMSISNAYEIASNRSGRSKLPNPTTLIEIPPDSRVPTIIESGQKTTSETADLSEALEKLTVSDGPHYEVSTDVPKDLEELFDSFERSFKEFVSPEPAVLIIPPDLEATVERLENPATSVNLSQSQRDIALAESKLWAALPNESDDLEDIISTASLLATRSELVSRSYRRSSELPNAQTYLESKEIIEAMGTRWIEALDSYEAEAVASSIVLNGLADYVASEDTDVLVYQAPLIRNITSHTDPLYLIHPSEIPTALNISLPSFIDFAILIGTDFSPRLKGLGPIRALKLIETYGDIDKILEETGSRYLLSTAVPEYQERVRVARKIFTTLPPPPSLDDLRSRTTYDAKVISNILEKYNLSPILQSQQLEDGGITQAFGTDFFATSSNSSEVNLGQDHSIYK